MVYRTAAKKTAGYMVTAMLLSLAVVTFISGDFQPVGRVTDAGLAPQPQSASWIVFLLGVFVGALVVGTYVYIAHIESKREE